MEVIKTVQSFDNTDVESAEIIAYCSECDVAAVVNNKERLPKNTLIRWHRDVDINCGRTLELYSDNKGIRPIRGTIEDCVKRVQNS